MPVTSNNLDFINHISRYINYTTLAHQCRLRNIISDNIIEEIDVDYINTDNKVRALLYKIIQLKKGGELSDVLFYIIDKLLNTIQCIPLH